MTAGGRRRKRPLRRGWGETVRHVPPSAPPEGIDLVIEKTLLDDDVIRRNRELRMEERRDQSDLADLADTVGDLTRPERDVNGRVIVDRTAALIGAAIVAVIAGVGFWVVLSFLNGASTPTP